MRPFLIDENVKLQLANLAAHAEKNPFSMDELLDIYNGVGKKAGDFEEFTLHFPFGYRVVFSIEDQPKAKVRHFSMSVDADNKLPNLEVVREVIKMLGFQNELENCLVKTEETGPNRMAINVWEPIL